MAVHMGVHLAFWPTRIVWGTEEETKECVETGVGMMTRAIAGDIDWLEGATFGGLSRKS